MKARLTETFVDRAFVPDGKPRATWWDAELPGFGLMVTQNAHKSFVVQYRVGGRSRRMHLDGVSKLRDARNQAKAILGNVAKGKALGEAIDPLEDRRRERGKDRNTLKAIITEYLEQVRDLRTIDQRESDFDRLVIPTLGNRQIEEIGRRDITRLLDDIAKNSGPVMADKILGHLRNLLNWHAARSDDYCSPIVRGMARTKPRERKRHRILTHAEIRAVWNAAEATAGPFGSMFASRFDGVPAQRNWSITSP